MTEGCACKLTSAGYLIAHKANTPITEGVLPFISLAVQQSRSRSNGGKLSNFIIPQPAHGVNTTYTKTQEAPIIRGLLCPNLCAAGNGIPQHIVPPAGFEPVFTLALFVVRPLIFLSLRTGHVCGLRVTSTGWYQAHTNRCTIVIVSPVSRRCLYNSTNERQVNGGKPPTYNRRNFTRRHFRYILPCER
jgi:hypothetical protein